MQAEETFANYLAATASVQRDLENLAHANAETYYINLTDIARYNEELYAQIQNRFLFYFPKLSESFRAYATSIVGRSFDLSFVNTPRRTPLRGLKSDTLGQLTSFAGIATRTSQVKPELAVGSFICRDCSTVIPNIPQDHHYTEPLFCPNDICTNRSKYEVDVKGSTFINWQHVNVQECAEEVPEGSLPRSMDVVVHNELVERIKPGSVLRFTGYTAALPAAPSIGASRITTSNEGVASNVPRRSSKDLDHRLVFFCIHADVAEEENDLTEIEAGTIARMQAAPNLYESMCDSLFPSIFGHRSIKAAILLMLVGGVPKDKGDAKLRGDINILLVGDPGTAKSQFLKTVATVSSPAVYTSGKSSTAAGLTVAVVRDPDTGEFTIEAGALMLADNGVCCIDEFDKMTYKDQVSIHEAMEQQTITIAKAGINATLNSRASILAAANPVKGRYDKRRTLRQNVNLSAPIMSRFDLYFVLVDEPGEANDRKIAKAILKNHLYGNPDEQRGREVAAERATAFTLDEAMLYVRVARKRRPALSREACEVLANKYVTMRQDSLANAESYKMTARQLESLIRLSEALAKLHNEKEVTVPHIEEAYRLVRSSAIEVCGDDVVLTTQQDEEEMLLSGKEYSRITNMLIYLVKSSRLSRAALVEAYLKAVESSLQSVSALAAEEKRCRRTIEFLIENEGVLFEMDDVVLVHPNYDV